MHGNPDISPGVTFEQIFDIDSGGDRLHAERQARFDAPLSKADFMCYIREDIGRRAQVFHHASPSGQRARMSTTTLNGSGPFNNGGLQSVSSLSGDLFYVGGRLDEL